MKVLYFESIANPSLKVLNIPELTRIGHKKGVIVLVNNMFAPKMIFVARLGVDVVVHNLTKFINGGGDSITRAVCGSKSFVNSLMDFQQGGIMLLGPTMDAKVTFEISERILHLGFRMKEHGRRALEYATRLKKLRIKVHYQGLKNTYNTKF
ncbi:unnamed protein product [Lathyrus sativus]|nr:unnamed protein product [Lathyrus sativus]